MKYVLFGCLGILVLGALITAGLMMFVYKKASDFVGSAEKNPAVAAVKMLAAVNPDVEYVSSDDNKGTVTIRQKSTGKTITVNLDDVKNGNISFSDEHGNTKISAGANWRPPEWVPVYPGAAFASGANADSDEQEGGGGGLSTSDSVEQVASFYESELKRLGMQANKTTMGVVATVTGQDEAGGRTVNVVIGNDGSKTTIQLSFSKKK